MLDILNIVVCYLLCMEFIFLFSFTIFCVHSTPLNLHLLLMALNDILKIISFEFVALFHLKWTITIKNCHSISIVFSFRFCCCSKMNSHYDIRICKESTNKPCSFVFNRLARNTVRFRRVLVANCFRKCFLLKRLSCWIDCRQWW